MFISKLVLGFSLVNDVDRNSNFKGRIIYTPMHGVGATYIDRAFQVAGFLPVVHVKEQKGPILVIALRFSLTYPLHCLEIKHHHLWQGQNNLEKCIWQPSGSLLQHASI